jgi:hypothetical protein
MPANEMFESALRTKRDLAGVFEFDGETGYFYLYETKANEAEKVIAAIRVITGSPDFEEEDISIVWDSLERTVGLFIRARLWAAFDGQTRAEYGGNYRANAQPSIPTNVVQAFEKG